MDGITDEELLTVKIPDPSPITLQHLIITARAAIKNHLDSKNASELDIEACQKLNNALYRGTKFASLGAYTTPTYSHLCDVRNISKNGHKEDLYNRLLESVCQNFFGFFCLIFQQIVAEKNTIPAQDIDETNRGPVLGKDVMNTIWSDMRKTVLPSWIGPAPKNWGTATRGKLGAEHWRTIFTIHLPITLIWLWRDETGRKRSLLDNMIDLHLAILTANLKRSNEQQASEYDMYIKKYLLGISELFREDNITPSQHSALHIGPELRRFGPTHSRSAHHYERYIHILQSQNTNLQWGKS